MLEKIITIYPAILDDQSNLVEQAHNLGQNESQQQIPTVAMSNTCNRQNNLLSKHQRHTDCFNSVSSEAINYILNLLMLSTTTLTAARQRQTVYFKLPGCCAVRGGEFISLALLLHQLLFSLVAGGRLKCHHLLLGISQQVSSPSAS